MCATLRNVLETGQGSIRVESEYQSRRNIRLKPIFKFRTEHKTEA